MGSIMKMDQSYNFIGLMSVYQWSGRPGFNTRSSHTKDSKMVLDAALLSTRHYKVRIKDKLEESKEWSSDLPYTSVLLLLKREPLGQSRLRSPSLLLLYYYI